jgi:transcriptional regulator of acetoin/glycerol metabolism
MHLPPLEARVKPLLLPQQEPVASTEPLPATLEEAERLFLERALRERKGSLRAAAKDLGISRGTLYRKVRKYNL